MDNEGAINNKKRKMGTKLVHNKGDACVKDGGST